MYHRSTLSSSCCLYGFVVRETGRPGQGTTRASTAWSQGPRRAASPRSRVLERDRMELGRFALPHSKELYTRSKELCEDTLSPGLGSEHNSSSSYNGPPGLQHGDSFARTSRLERGPLRTPTQDDLGSMNWTRPLDGL